MEKHTHKDRWHRVARTSKYKKINKPIGKTYRCQCLQINWSLRERFVWAILAIASFTLQGQYTGGGVVCLSVCFWSQTNLGSNLNSITNKLIFRKVIWTLFSHLKTGHKNTKWNVVGFYEIKFISTHGWCSMKVSFSFFSKHAHVGFTEKWYVFNISQIKRTAWDGGCERSPPKPLLSSLWKCLYLLVRIHCSQIHDII